MKNKRWTNVRKLTEQKKKKLIKIERIKKTANRNKGRTNSQTKTKKKTANSGKW